MFAIQTARVLFAVLLIWLGAMCLARSENNGRFPPGEKADWFATLHSQYGLCCSGADGKTIRDVDWKITEDGYSVYLEDRWIIVEPKAVIHVKNKYGVPVVWPIFDSQGNVSSIRCFLPGVEG